jgi:hypothetical protein
MKEVLQMLGPCHYEYQTSWETEQRYFTYAVGGRRVSLRLSSKPGPDGQDILVWASKIESQLRQ